MSGVSRLNPPNFRILVSTASAGSGYFCHRLGASLSAQGSKQAPTSALQPQSLSTSGAYELEPITCFILSNSLNYSVADNISAYLCNHNMSGAEAFAVLSVISSLITIIEGTKKVLEAASSTKGLPEAFREVATRLPIVLSILSSAKHYIGEGNEDEKSCMGVKDVVEGCQKKATKLEEIFQKVVPAEDASRPAKYAMAVRTLGKESRVETLMKRILEDVQLLAANHSMRTITDSQRNEVAQAMQEVAALPPSLPEHAPDETGFTATHYGSGAINQALGDQYNHVGDRYHAQSMTFGSRDGAQACMMALFQAVRTDPHDDRARLIQKKGTKDRWLEDGADIEAKNRLGGTPLHVAAGAISVNMVSVVMVQFLLEKGADPEAKDNDGLTPLELATTHSDDERYEGVIRALSWKMVNVFARRELIHRWRSL